MIEIEDTIIESEEMVDCRKDVLFGNLNFLNSLLKQRLIPMKTVCQFSKIALEKFVNSYFGSQPVKELYLEVVIKLLEYCG